VHCRTTNFFRYELITKLIFYFIFYCILFYDYCVLPLRVHGCAWQLLIKKYDNDDDVSVIFMFLLWAHNSHGTQASVRNNKTIRKKTKSRQANNDNKKNPKIAVTYKNAIIKLIITIYPSAQLLVVIRLSVEHLYTSTYGPWGSFIVSGPISWNSLPPSLHDPSLISPQLCHQHFCSENATSL